MAMKETQSKHDCPKGGKHKFDQLDYDHGDNAEYGFCSQCFHWINTVTGEDETERNEKQQTED